MDSSRTRIVSRRPDDPVNFPAKTNISSRRSLSSFSFSSSSFSSFSSCSSSSLVFSGDSPLNYSPATPHRLLGVPFSWEQLPGKPKNHPHRLNHSRNEDSSNLLPLPPHRNTHFPATGKSPKSNKSSKKNSFLVTVRDPFAAALLECSKGEGNSEEEDDDDDGEDVGNFGGSSKALSKSSIGNRFGLVNLYGSCRRTCAVSESIVHLPRSTAKATSYDNLLLTRRRL